MTSNLFLNIRSVTDLCIYLGLSESNFNYYIFRLQGTNYQTFQIKKRNGNSRIIAAPIKPLREMQEKIAAALKEIYQPRSHVTAYVKDRGFRYNAAIHQKKRWVAKIDIEDFFPSIHFGRVQSLFQNEPFNFTEIVAQRLAQVICHNGSLPQGGVTSPVISNMVCRGLDHDLRKLAIRSKTDFSRYCDDIVFSTNLKNFPISIMIPGEGKPIASEEIQNILTKHGFKVNSTKSRLYSKGVAQHVTGVVVNNGLAVKSSYKKELRAILHGWHLKGLSFAYERYLSETFQRSRWDGELTESGFSMAVFSKIMHVGHIEGHTSVSFKKLLHSYCKLNPDAFKTLHRVLSRKPTRLIIYTEGYTDRFILEKAFLDLSRKIPIGDLQIIYQESPVSGFTGLLQCAQNLCSTAQRDITIILFDRDVDKGRMNEIDDGTGFRHWGNNVYSMLLPPVNGLQDQDICLETLFPLSQLQQEDAETRRFYLRSEFDTDGLSHDKKMRYSKPKTKKLLCDNANGKVENELDKTDRKNYLMSKKVFAINVKNEVSPFQAMDFTNFKALFFLLKGIKNQHLIHFKP